MTFALNIEPAPLLEWNFAVRLMSRNGLDHESRRAAAVLTLRLAPGSYAELVRMHAAAGWPEPPEEVLYQAVLGQARELVTCGRLAENEVEH